LSWHTPARLHLVLYRCKPVWMVVAGAQCSAHAAPPRRVFLLDAPPDAPPAPVPAHSPASPPVGEPFTLGGLRFSPGRSGTGSGYCTAVTVYPAPPSLVVLGLRHTDADLQRIRPPRLRTLSQKDIYPSLGALA